MRAFIQAMALLACFGTAHGVTLGFDNVPEQSAPLLYHEAGFTVVSPFAYYRSIGDIDIRGWTVDRGTLYECYFYPWARDCQVTITNDRGEFIFTGFDASTGDEWCQSPLPHTHSHVFLGVSGSLNGSSRYHYDVEVSCTLAPLPSGFGGVAIDSLTIGMDYARMDSVRIDNLDVTPVPEPETYGLMLTGLVGLAVAAQRRRSKALNGMRSSARPASGTRVTKDRLAVEPGTP